MRKMIRSLVAGIAILSFTAPSYAQIIITLAGNNAIGYSGDGSAATAAAIGMPWGVATDRSGNIYIADAYNNVVRKVTLSGTITTIAGSGVSGYSGDGSAATGAKLNNPQGIAIDSSGNLYIADDGNFVLRKVNSSGIISTVAGNHAYGYSGDGSAATAAEMYGAIGVAIDKHNNIYLSDGNNTVRKINSFGTITLYAGSSLAYGYSGDGGEAVSASMANPSGIALDDTGNLYIADNQNNVVRKVDTFGYITTVAGNGYLGESGGFPPTGAYSGDGGSAVNAELNEPSGIAVDKWGNLFIGDQANNVVRKVDATGTISTVAGNGYDASEGYGGYSGDSGLATNAMLNYPAGLAIDSSGNLYIADQQNYVIRKVQNISIVSSAGDTVCSNSPLTFTAYALSAGPLVNYQWLINGVDTFYGNNSFSLDSLHAGSTVSCLLVNNADDNGIALSNDITEFVTAASSSSVTITSAPSGSICSGDSVTFIAAGTATGSTPTYIWSVNGSEVASGADSVYVYMPSNGDNVTCKLISSLPCAIASRSNSLIMNVISTPVLSLNVTYPGEDSVCSVSSTTFAAASSGAGSDSTYSWSVNGSIIADSTDTFSYRPSLGDIASGSYTLVCTITSRVGTLCSLAGASVSDTEVVGLMSPVIPYVSIASLMGDTVCAGTSVTFTASVTNGGIYPLLQWYINGVLSGTGDTFSYVPSDADHVTCLLTSSACAITDTATSNLVKMAVQTVVIPSVSIAASADSVCSGTSVHFSSVSANGGSAPSYQWYVNGVGEGTDTSFTYYPSSGGTVVCRFISNSACAITDTVFSDSVTISVHATVVPSLVVTASIGDTLCAGSVDTFTALGYNAGSAPVYTWYIDGYSVFIGTSYYYAPVSGDSVKCLLISDAVCAATDSAFSASRLMVVRTPGTPAVSINSFPARDTICAGTSVSYTATATNGGIAPVYTWSVNGTYTSTGAFFTYMPSSGDVIVCELTSDAPCISAVTATSSVTVTVLPDETPSVSISSRSGDSVCSGVSISFTAASSYAGTAPVFHWYKNGVYVLSDTTYTYIPASGDIVSCVLISDYSCVTSDTAYSSGITMVVTPSVVPSVGVTASATVPVCAGTIVSFSAATANGGAAPLLQWLKNGFAVGTGTSYSYDPITADVITFMLVSSAVCAVPDTVISAPITMTVNPVVTPSVAITVSPGDTVCSGSSVTFTPIPHAGGASPVYNWIVNSIYMASGSSYIYVPSSGDSVICELISDAACATVDSAVSLPQLMNTTADVTPSVSISASPGTTVTAGTAVTFSASAVNGGSAPDYQWYINGIAIPGATSSVFIVDTFSATDSVACRLVSNAPCATPLSVQSPALYINIGEGVALLPGASNVQLSPNPNKGYFKVKGELNDKTADFAFYQVLDMLGRTVLQGTAPVNAGGIDDYISLGESVSPGMYMLKIVAENEVVVIHFDIEK